MESKSAAAGQPEFVRVLWTHNFDPANSTSGVFMYTTAEGLRSRGVDLELEYLGNLRSPTQIVRARGRVRQKSAGFDIVHAQYGSACALVTAAADGVPKVLTLRGSDWQTYGSSTGFHFYHSRLAAMMTRWAVRHYNCVTVVSRRIAGSLSEGVPEVPIKVLPSPIDLLRFKPLDKREARRQLGHPDNDEKWILFNSRHIDNPVKRFSLAKQAFDLARKKHSGLRLRLATEMPHNEIPLFTAACDLIVCTSENEGWPNSIKEALACNVPFVATDVGDLREIANVEPSCRICPASAAVIAQNICDVLRDPAPEGLRRHAQSMGVETICDKLISIYDSIIR